MISTQMASQGIFRRTLLVTMLTHEYERSPVLGIPVSPGVVQVGAREPTVLTSEQSLAV